MIAIEFVFLKIKFNNLYEITLFEQSRKDQAFQLYNNKRGFIYNKKQEVLILRAFIFYSTWNLFLQSLKQKSPYLSLTRNLIQCLIYLFYTQERKNPKSQIL